MNIMYAVIPQTMADVKVEFERAQKREDGRPKPYMVAVHRMERPRQCFIAMFENQNKFAIRKELESGDGGTATGFGDGCIAKRSWSHFG